jgi:8-oxo-dGTP pyrophosphatase MutT (NUDIX family)
MITQYGVIAWKESEAAGRLVLLITSRETRRWVIPRGNPMPGLSASQVAAQEAWEEAGIRGDTSLEEVGTYPYRKKQPDGSFVPAEVRLFSMEVREEADAWPEMRQRERRWFTPAEAAEAVDEPELRLLILAFVPPPEVAGGRHRALVSPPRRHRRGSRC